jgi:hypothetical protein
MTNKNFEKLRIKKRDSWAHTLIALAAPWDLSTPSDPDFATSEGSSAVNFILMSCIWQVNNWKELPIKTYLFTAP